MNLYSGQKNIFFMGKGGTGKTTISALASVHLADTNQQVALISLDPAHNLFDVFDVSPSKNTIKIDRNLSLEEVDIKYWISTYLASIEKKISQSYKYLTSLNLDKQLSILQYSPGLEEYALMYAYQAINQKYKNTTFRIFDMPPTALSIRFINLPALSQMWLDKLIELRKKILKNKNIIQTVRSGKKNVLDDGVLTDLYQMQRNYQDLSNAFRSQKATAINLVLNEDNLSIKETFDISEKLKQVKIHIHNVIINRYQGRISRDELQKQFDNVAMDLIPQAQLNLLGLKNLRSFIADHKLGSKLATFF